MGAGPSEAVGPEEAQEKVKETQEKVVVGSPRFELILKMSEFYIIPLARSSKNEKLLLQALDYEGAGSVEFVLVEPAFGELAPLAALA
ncbi:unnamed protein product [marine sediment metagenome]|uniref:Uncharacterized protein n=1 Tax=marine sediment metagenome TaxID=412755 RepID=X1MQG8_9ZZZZ